MFGVTTPCVEACDQLLRPKDSTVSSFNATERVGRAMDKLVEAGLIWAFSTSRPRKWPTMWSAAFYRLVRSVRCNPRGRSAVCHDLGALDMVNFGAMATVPERFQVTTAARYTIHTSR